MNNGISGYVDYFDEEHKIKGGCLAVGLIGMQFFFMEKDFYAGQFTKRAVPKNFELTPKIALYFISILNKKQKVFQNVLVRNFEKEFKSTQITLPIKNNKIDFEFMESFIAELDAQRIAELDAQRIAELDAQRIAELDAYLSVSGLKDYTLTEEENKVLNDFSNGKIIFDEFAFKEIFNRIEQGKRLKKFDQAPGNIPFIMAGVTNTGVANYISNPIAVFPKNSITIDIFGNTFYRNFSFGAGDDTGIYWNDSIDYLREDMLYFAVAMKKALEGKFTYGKKLRSSQSFDFKMKLPVKNGELNFEVIRNFIDAIQKLVIKDLVFYNDLKMAAAKRAVNNKK